MVLSGQESGVTPLVLAKGIANMVLGSGNATNNNLASAWASVAGNMGSGWANGLANMGSGLAREATSLVWENGTNSSMGLVLAKGLGKMSWQSMVTSGDNERCSRKLALILSEYAEQTLRLHI